MVLIDGKNYDITSSVLDENNFTWTNNVAARWCDIAEYEVLKTEIAEFDSKHDRNNEIYMKLQKAGPAEIADDSKIRIIKANSKNQFVKSIWEGTYGQLPDSSERTNINNIVTPNAKVRLDEGFKILIQLYTAADVIDNTICTVQIRYWTLFRR